MSQLKAEKEERQKELQFKKLQLELEVREKISSYSLLGAQDQ